MDEVKAIETVVTYGSYAVSALMTTIGLALVHAARRAPVRRAMTCQRKTLQVTGLGCVVSGVFVAMATFLG